MSSSSSLVGIHNMREMKSVMDVLWDKGKFEIDLIRFDSIVETLFETRFGIVF